MSQKDVNRAELDAALRRLERATKNLERQLHGSTCRRVARKTVRYALNPAQAIVDGIEALVDLALD